MKVIYGLIRVLFIVAFIGFVPLVKTQAQNLTPDPPPFQSADFNLDGVDLRIHAPFIPGPFITSEPSDAIQMATSAQLGDYQEIAITTVPYGTRPPTENLPVARPGSEGIYRTDLNNNHNVNNATNRNGPSARLFGQWVPSTFNILEAPVQGNSVTSIIMVEWVVELGGRVWIVRIGQLYDGPETLAEELLPLARLQLDSPDASAPSASLQARHTPAFQHTPPTVQSLASLFALGDMPSPSWWQGDCDTNYYKTQGAKIDAKPLGAVFRGLKACGPRPYFDNVPDVLVRYFPGAWGEYEWECVELSMRYLYLAHSVKPYSGNGKDVVTNYRIYNPNGELVVVHNDTVGTAPVPGDVLSYGTTGWGHTSVVMASDVNSTTGSGTITVIEQNNSATGSKVLTVTNWHVYASTIVTGWLHDPYQITDLALSGTRVAENQPAGTVVGTFTATDQNPNATHSYALVSGAGDTENIFFTIDGNQLKTAVVLNYEVLKTYNIRGRVSNNNGDVFEKKLVVTVTDTNDPPTDITLSNTKITEQKPVGTVIGTIKAVDEDATGSYTYTLVSGIGSDDNSVFSISGSSLLTKAVFDYETKNTFTIRARVTDQGGLTVEKTFSISINDINEAPNNINLVPNSAAENQPTGTTVGTLSASDQDINDSHTFSLVAGSGDSDNISFSISNNILKTKAVFDYETKKSYTIRVRATDKGGLIYEKAIAISITNTNDPPTGIQLSKTSVPENQPAGIEVGTFSATDPDSIEPFTYTLVAGTGSTDNSAFIISGKILKTAATFDYEAKTSMSIRVRVTDSTGLTYEKQFSITITNNNDPPTAIKISKSSVSENQPVGTKVGTLSAVDQDGASEIFIYTLVAGIGDNDNSQFTLNGTSLLTNAIFDAEKRSVYSIRLRTEDNGGLSFEQPLTITISGVNEYPPTDILLDKNNIAENQAVGVTVGNFSSADLDFGDTHTYSLVSGTGSQDNAAFSISGNFLKTKKVFNYEVKNSYSIRVRTTDAGSLQYEKQLTINILDVNDAPTGVHLDPNIQAENTLTNSTIGTLSSDDEDAGDSFTYALVTGIGSDDNGSFTLQGNHLLNKTVFDYETKTSYTIRVRTTDKGGLYYELPFLILVTPVNEFPPTDLLLDHAAVAENLPLNSAVGIFSTVDQDKGDTMVYELVPGSGDDDNARFLISGNQLQTNTVFDYNIKNTYTIRVRVTDCGRFIFEKTFQIQIQDQLEFFLPFVDSTP